MSGFLVFSIIVLAAMFIVALFSFPRKKRQEAPVTERGEKRPLKVLMFGWEFPPHNSGGLGVACHGIANALAENGTEITFVLPKKLPVSLPHIQFVSADIENLAVREVASAVRPYASTGSYAVTATGEPLYGNDLVSEVKRYATVARQLAREIPHDVIYAHDWLSLEAARAAKEVSGKPYIAHIHATEHERTGGIGENNAIRAIEHAGLVAADCVVAVSRRTKNVITREYGIPASKIQVVHNGIDDRTALAGDLTESGLLKLKARGFKIVLFMGRITLQKGPDYFVRAAAKVLKYDPRVMFIMAGSGDMERSVMELAAQLGIGNRILFPGFLRDGEQYEAVRRADVFVMPSVAEPFGLSALEAMRLGTPVIVSKQSGISEASVHMLTADFWDTDELAHKILSVLHRPVLANHLSAEGKKSSDNLSWSRAAEKLHGLMDDLVPRGFSYS